MAAVDDLIGELASDGEVEAEGDFTLDRDKARDKMRQFQLADPHRYVLILIGAAAHQSATRIDFRIDTDDMEMHFDGAPFTREDLEDLYVSMFGDRGDERLRARQDLAVALNAAMALNPRWIRLRSAAEGQAGVVVTMRPGVDDDIADADDLPAGTHIHVKERFRAGLLVRFVDSLRGRVPEEVVLRQRCRYAEQPIMLGEERISHGMSLSGVWGETRVTKADVKAVAGFSPMGEPASLIVLVNGVELTTHALESYPRGFVAMADCSALRRDVSQADVVRDRAYKRLLGQLVRAREQALVEMVKQFGPLVRGLGEHESVGEHADADPGVELHYEFRGGGLVHVDDAGQMRPWVPAMFLGELERAVHLGSSVEKRELTQMLRGLHFWCCVDGEYRTTADFDAQTRVAFTTEVVEHFDREKHALTIHAPTKHDRKILRSVFGERLVDRTATLVREAERYANRERWKSRPREAKLGDGVYLARGAITSTRQGAQGEVGLRATGGERPSISVIVEGCLLLEVQPRLYLPGLVVVLAADLTPNANFDGLQRDAALAAALADSLDAVMRVLTQAAVQLQSEAELSAPRIGLFKEVIRVVSVDELTREWFAALGLKRRAVDHHVAKLIPADGKPSWMPDWGLDGGDPHPIAKLPLWPCLGAKRFVSLVEIAKSYRELGRIDWVPMLKADIEPPNLVLRFTKSPELALQAVFGEQALNDASSHHRGWFARSRHLQKPALPLALPGSVLGKPFAFQTEHGRGLVGLAWDASGMPPKTRGSIAVDVRSEQRQICVVSTLCPLPAVTAVIDDTSIEADNDYSKLASREERDRVLGMVLAALGEGLVGLVKEDDEALPAGVVQWMLAAAFPHARFFNAYRLLLEQRGPDKAREAYVQLLGLVERWNPIRIAQFLTRRGKDKRINVSAIERKAEAQLEKSKSSYSNAQAKLRLKIATVLPRLSTLAVFPRADGGRASLEDMRAVLEDGEPIRWLSREPGSAVTPVETDGTFVLRLTEVERRALESIVGAQPLEDADEWFKELQARRVFEAKPVLETLSVADSDALVRVPVKRRDFEGEVALRRSDPNTTRPVVFACRDRRPLGWVEPPVEFPVVAVLSGTELGDETGGELSRDDLLTLGRLVDGCDKDLANALAQQWPQLPESDRPLAQAWARWLMVHLGSPAGRKGLQALGKLDPLPVFPLADGGRASLTGLREAEKRHDRLRGIVDGEGVASLPDEPVLDLRDPVVRSEVEALFAHVVDHRRLHADEAARREREDKAGPLPEPPGDALISLDLRAGGIRGSMWIGGSTAFEAVIHLGTDGKVVESRYLRTELAESLRDVLPCSASIEGPGAKVNEAWTAIALRKSAVRTLVRTSIELYGTLSGEYARRLESGETPASDVEQGRAPLSALRRRLVEAAIELARRPGDDLSNDRRKLARRLGELPLLQLATGRYISIEVARRERPMELHHLGLWDDPQPAPAEAEGAGETKSEGGAAPEGEAEAEGEGKADGEGEDELALAEFDLSEDLDADAKPDDEAVSADAPQASAEPDPAPEPPPPPPPPPTPAERLLEAIRGELRMVRANNRELLSDAHLDGIRIDARDGELVAIPDRPATLDAKHEIVARVLATDGDFDPMVISFLASAVYTAINIELGEVTDKDEADFLDLHAAHVATAG